MATVMMSGTTPQWSTREPLARAPEAAHDLIADQQDAVLGAELTQPLQVAVGRDNDAVGAGDGLDDDGGEVLRSLEGDDILDVTGGSPACRQAYRRTSGSDSGRDPSRAPLRGCPARRPSAAGRRSG